jgi:hypothetical protein
MSAPHHVARSIQTLKLPLAYSSHRQIIDADRNLVIEVFSGGPGIDAADQLQDLVVVACNSYSLMVDALKAADDLSRIGLLNAPDGEIERVNGLRRIALAAAGVA